MSLLCYFILLWNSLLNLKTCLKQLIVKTSSNGALKHLPSLRTKTKSLSITVWIRWAIVTTVRLLNSWQMISCITSSVAESTEAVASSSTNMLLFFSKALPRQNNCLCPALQLSPFSTTGKAFQLLVTMIDYYQKHNKLCKLIVVNESNLGSPTSHPWLSLGDLADIYLEPENENFICIKLYYIQDDLRRCNEGILVYFILYYTCYSWSSCLIKVFTSQTSMSEYCSRGSRFPLTVPSNKAGSCGIMLSLDLKSWRPICRFVLRRRFSSFQEMCKWCFSALMGDVQHNVSVSYFIVYKRRYVRKNWTHNLNHHTLCPKFSWYQTCKFWKDIVPVSGQFLGGRQFSITRGDSLAKFVYWRILSTDIILFSALQMFHITEACKTFRLIPYVTANPAMPVTYRETNLSIPVSRFISQ